MDQRRPRVIEPVVGQRPKPPEPGRYLREDERVAIADGVAAGKSARTISSELGRAVSTIARELDRNSIDGVYRPHAAHQLALSRRPRPRPRRLEVDAVLRKRVQELLDKRWSPEQIAHELRSVDGCRIAPETIYQALYSPRRCVNGMLASCCGPTGPTGGHDGAVTSVARGSWARSG